MTTVQNGDIIAFGANLKEVFASTKHASPSIVVIGDGTSLWDGNTLIGMIITFVQTLFSCNCFFTEESGFSPAEKNKIAANGYINNSFRELEGKMEGAVAAFIQGISQKVDGNKSNLSAYREARRTLNEWNNQILPFIKEWKKDPRKFSHVLAHFTYNEPLYKRIRKCQAIINLELRADNIEAPFRKLRRLALMEQADSLTGKQKSSVKGWIDQINATGSDRFDNRHLHKGLYAFSLLLADKMQMEATSLLTKIEAALIDMDCKVLHDARGSDGISGGRRDINRHHLKWREENLLPGSVVAYEGGLLTLEDEIAAKEHPYANHNKICTVSGRDDLLVISCRTPVQALLKFQPSEQIPDLFAEWRWVDPQGRYAVVEKVDPLPESRERADILLVRTFMLNCIQRRITPAKLACRNLGMRNGAIVSCQPGYSKTLDYFKYQRFIIEFADGNQAILNDLLPSVRGNMKNFINDNFIDQAIDGLKVPFHENPDFAKIERDIASQAHAIHRAICALPGREPDTLTRSRNEAKKMIKESVREAFDNNLPLLDDNLITDIQQRIIAAASF